MCQKAKFVVTDYETGEDVALPAHFAVCDRCNGTGVHDHEAFSNGISQEQFDEDPDFKESYFRGHYDVKCSVCDGERVVAVPNEAELNEQQRKLLADHYEARAEAAAERRMRANGIEF